jgi:hypothetical protein
VLEIVGGTPDGDRELCDALLGIIGVIPNETDYETLVALA